LLANWDGIGGDDEQFLRAFGWDGASLTPTFSVDFRAAGLGRPHIMHLGSMGFAAARGGAGSAPGPAR
jgi:selenium-binding protein 1